MKRREKFAMALCVALYPRTCVVPNLPAPDDRRRSRFIYFSDPVDGQVIYVLVAFFLIIIVVVVVTFSFSFPLLVSCYFYCITNRSPQNAVPFFV